MNWLKLIDPEQRPIYVAVADAIEQAIEDGELHAGNRLPTHRHLAQILGLDLTTITRAYSEARRRGLLNATVGSGTFVRAFDRRSEVRSFVDMAMNLPPQPQDPSLRALLHDGLSSLIKNTDLVLLMAYRAGAGSAPDREAAALWLRPIVEKVDPKRILVCAGAQIALTALLTLLVRPGETILTDPLTYPNFRALAAYFGVHLRTVQTDADGMLPDAIERACADGKPRAIYCVPTIHNPTTATMSVERRQSLAAVATRHGITVIEDDAYGMLPQQPLPAITTFAPDCTYYIGTISKCISPGFRIAYVVAPDPAQAQRLAEAVRTTSLAPSPLLTSLITNWIGDGTAASLRAAIRNENAERQRIAMQVLQSGSARAHPNGPHLWLTLPDHWKRAEFIAYIRKQGLSLVPSDAFLVESPAPNAVRICLGAANSQIALRSALQSIAQTMRMDGSHHLTDVI